CIFFLDSCLYIFITLYTFFSYTHTAPTEIYTLSLHDALPISIVKLDAFAQHEFVTEGVLGGRPGFRQARRLQLARHRLHHRVMQDRKSTRLNSSHRTISYAVFCLKKKK